MNGETVWMLRLASLEIREYERPVTKNSSFVFIEQVHINLELQSIDISVYPTHSVAT